MRYPNDTRFGRFTLNFRGENPQRTSHLDFRRSSSNVPTLQFEVCVSNMFEPNPRTIPNLIGFISKLCRTSISSVLPSSKIDVNSTPLRFLCSLPERGIQFQSGIIQTFPLLRLRQHAKNVPEGFERFTKRLMFHSIHLPFQIMDLKSQSVEFPSIYHAG